ncbi:ras-related protein Rab-26-like isoform 2-T4 [Salvelinus alpinus]
MTGSPTGKQNGKTGKSTAGTGSVVQANGMVHPSRPSLSNSSEFYDIAFKVMLVGDSGVGKTCLLVRFKDGAFLAGSFISTVGIDFRNKVLNIDRLKVKLQIWDTAGQERFRSVTHAYYRDANALLLLYDVTNRTSFDNIKAASRTIRLSVFLSVRLPACLSLVLLIPRALRGASNSVLMATERMWLTGRVSVTLWCCLRPVISDSTRWKNQVFCLLTTYLVLFTFKFDVFSNVKGF